jgi:hypothetical protein
MAKNQNTQVAQKQATEQTSGTGTDESKVVDLNTGAASGAPQGGSEGDQKGPSDEVKGAGVDAAALEATLADVGELAEEVFARPASLGEHVSSLLALAEKEHDTASQNVLNRIHVKLSEFKHVLTSIEPHVLESATGEVQDLVGALAQQF